MPSLYLQSQSVRRRRILEDLNIPFKVLIPLFPIPEEIAHPQTVFLTLIQNARKKAQAGLQLLETQEIDRSAKKREVEIVIAADTLVYTNDTVFGKPKDQKEAREMLQILSNSVHSVSTALYLQSNQGKEVVKLETTQVFFRKIQEEELEAYLSLKEPYDKAGGYAVQGFASTFVKKVEGCFLNVVGFPVNTFLSALEEISGVPIFSWGK